jgi:hypothetical protein
MPQGVAKKAMGKRSAEKVGVDENSWQCSVESNASQLLNPIKPGSNVWRDDRLLNKVKKAHVIAGCCEAIQHRVGVFLLLHTGT